jgi:hypothetical protein
VYANGVLTHLCRTPSVAPSFSFGRGGEVDSRIGWYASDFEVLLESSLPAAESVEFIRRVAEELS